MYPSDIELVISSPNFDSIQKRTLASFITGNINSLISNFTRQRDTNLLTEPTLARFNDLHNTTSNTSSDLPFFAQPLL